MTPTLFGRIQTRIFLLILVGAPWTLVATPLLPSPGGSRSDLYAVTFSALGIVAAAGVLWEIIYHGLQQFRWEKDWPTMFGLLTGVNEGIVAWWLLREFGPMGEPPVADGATFVAHFAPLWILVWLVAIGPIKIFLLRWRFRGGRVL